MTKEEATNHALDFLARNFETLASLAWPIVVLIALSMFKSEIVKLLPHAKFKHGNTEVSFGIEQALKTEATVTFTEAPTPQASQVEESHFERLLAISPHAAMVEIRYEIEQALNAADAATPEPGINPFPRYEPPSKRVLSLAKRGLISFEVAELLRELLHVGNMAAHDRRQDVSVSDARNYRRMADRCISALKRVASGEYMDPASAKD